MTYYALRLLKAFDCNKMINVVLFWYLLWSFQQRIYLVGLKHSQHKLFRGQSLGQNF